MSNVYAFQKPIAWSRPKIGADKKNKADLVAYEKMFPALGKTSRWQLKVISVGELMTGCENDRDTTEIHFSKHEPSKIDCSLHIV